MANHPTHHYPDVDANPNFAALEEATLKHWQEKALFKQSVDNRPASHADASNNALSNEFVFYDGPPFANGLPHYGHLLTGYVKDAIARYQTMQGKRVERRFGWDCHGLPAEMGAEKELGISGRGAIQEFGIKKFNEHCRSSVMKYAGEWEYYVDRQGRWVDFADDYKTMDKNFMESVLWAFKQLYDKGYVYEAYRVMPYSWAAETPLSNFETKLDNSYREKEDKAITVAFELNEAPKGAPKADTYFALAWTTTPWTLPSNLALAVGGDVEYVAITSPSLRAEQSNTPSDHHAADASGDGETVCYILAKSALATYAKELGYDEESSALSTLEASHLIGLSYKPLFPYFKDHPNSFRILDGSHFVEDGSGTGIVHMAPGFGEDDQKTCEAHGIELIVPVDGQGKYTDAIFDIGREELPSPCGRVEEAKPQAAAESGGGEFAIHLPTGDFPTEPRKFKRDEKLIEYAKDMRKNSTDAERKLWNILHAETFDSCKFRRQEVVGHYIADFISYTKRLVIELDGSQHADEQNLQYDQKRTKFFTDQGYTVIRFWNHDVLDRTQSVAEAIISAIAPPPDSPALYAGSSPLPQGEGNLPPLSLRGLNVIAQTQGQCEDEPYKPEQLAKYGLVNLRIIQWLKMRGQLVKQENFKHNYPHCWRTDTPLIYRALPSWYVAVTKFKDKAVALNKDINWVPSHIGPGQMEHMLSTAPDWSISRNRFWGTPIPVWKGDKGGIKVFGSIAELEEFFGKTPSPSGRGLGEGQSPIDTNPLPSPLPEGEGVVDLHRPYIDQLVKTDEHGETWTRVEDVFDCWFESGSMPFAQLHYPFENKERFEANFPADFITEYVGQTRGWFNTLIMLTAGVFSDHPVLDGKPPFINCICHGVVLDSETGMKYSKRLKNYKDPREVMDQYGADALRWLMLASPVMRGMDISVDPEGKFIRDVVRLAIKPIWNAYNFFVMYANADGIKAKASQDSEHIMDRYILAKCGAAIRQIETSLNGYDTTGACDAVLGFFEVLNNWYIRRSKERFWKEEKDADKQAAYDTLYSVLTDMCRAAAPLLPFTLDAVYRGLTGEESVHVADFPTRPANSEVFARHSTQENGETSLSPNLLLTYMDLAQDICNAALGIRSKLNIRVRQPLASLTIISKKPVDMGMLSDIIRDEVNVKAINTSTNFDEAATLKLQVNSKVLGKRLPAMMKQVLPASKKGEWTRGADGTMTVAGVELLESEYDLQLQPHQDIAAQAQALSSNDALVMLDIDITPQLASEGYARDMVRMIQQARKDAGLNITDRITLALSGDDTLLAAAGEHEAYITEQTLADGLMNKAMSNADYSTEQAIEGQPLHVSLKKST